MLTSTSSPPSTRRASSATAIFKTRYATAGNVHTRHETQFLNPARIGKMIKVYGTLVDKYLKRGREYLVMECRSVDEDGIEICRDRRTIIIRYAKRPE
jgi:acyl dehydratase